MSISLISHPATTKKGNEYKKSNVAKTSTFLAGAAFSGYAVTRPGVNFTAKKVFAGIRNAAKNPEFAEKITKNLKKYVIASKAVAVAMVMTAAIGVGVVTDAIVNKVKAKKADKAAQKA